MACASTVAVVVPSPATSEVLLATSFTIWAPMFAILSSSSISLATVTPSLVTVGAPHDFSMTTLRPRGPRVTLTALASVLSPCAICARATWLKTISLAAMVDSSLLLDDGEDVVLAQDEVLLTVDLDFAPRVLAEEHLVAGLDVELAQAPVLEELAVADGDHLGLDRLLLRGVGDVEAAGGALRLGQALDEDAVVQRTNGHTNPSLENVLAFLDEVWVLGGRRRRAAAAAGTLAAGAV